MTTPPPPVQPLPPKRKTSRLMKLVLFALMVFFGITVYNIMLSSREKAEQLAEEEMEEERIRIDDEKRLAEREARLAAMTPEERAALEQKEAAKKARRTGGRTVGE